MLDVTFLLSAFVTALVTIAPFETAPVFVGLARHLTPDDRRRTARRAVMISGLVLIASPGSLLAVVLLMGQAAGNPWHVAGVLVVLAVCLLLTWGRWRAQRR